MRYLRFAEEFTDITLACDDNHEINAHMVILAASSPFFHNILRKKNCSNPIVFFRGMATQHLLPVVDFIYQGEVNISEENLSEFLNIAKYFQLRGLQSEVKADEKITNISDEQYLPVSQEQ